MCHGSLPTKLNWLQQWFRIKQDYFISFQGAFVLHLFFFLSSFYWFSLWKVKNLFLVCPTFLLLFFWSYFDVGFTFLIMLQVAPEVLNQDQRSDDRYFTDCEDCPHGFLIQNKKHWKWSRKKNVLLMIYKYIPALHNFLDMLCLCPLPYYLLYADLQLSSVDCEIIDTD